MSAVPEVRCVDVADPHRAEEAGNKPTSLGMRDVRLRRDVFRSLQVSFRQAGPPQYAELMDLYPQFYFDNVSPYLQTAIRYLNVTSSGRKWIATLYSNIFRAQRELRISGPQH